jgi:hypothetical protein
MVIKNILYKKSFLLITLAIIFTGSNILAISNPGHSADEILITINRISMSLQEAIDNEFLKDNIAPPTQDNDYTKTMLKGHDANKITISIDGEKSLQETIDDTQISFCQDVNPWDLVRKLISNIGHFSDKIDVQFEGQPTTLQAMIDNSEFCSYSWKELGDWSDCSANPYWGSCSVSCGPGTKSCQSTSGTETRTIYCERSDGKTDGITDIQCTNDGQGPKPDASQSCIKSCTGSNTCNLGSCSPPLKSSNNIAKCSSWTHVSGTKWRCNSPQIYKTRLYYKSGGKPYFKNWDGAGAVWAKINGGTHSDDTKGQNRFCVEFSGTRSSWCSYSNAGAGTVTSSYDLRSNFFACSNNQWCNIKTSGSAKPCNSIVCKF